MTLSEDIRRRVLPMWARTATLKGLLLVVTGLVLLVIPEITLPVVRVAVGASLILAGLVDVLDGLRQRGEARTYELTHGVTNVALGGALLLIPGQALRLVLFIAAAYLAVRALSLVLSAWRDAGPSRPMQFLWGSAFAAAAVLVVLAPDNVVSSLIVLLGLVFVLVGGVLLAAGLSMPEDETMALGVSSVPFLLRVWAESQDIGTERRRTIGETLYFEPPSQAGKLGAFSVMLLLSVAIATFGVMQDSTAVVIGAMIVAPLMIPILGLAGAIVNAWPKRLLGSLALLVAGSAAAVLLAMIIGRWAPQAVPLEVNSQVTSRIAPNVLDMGIALSAGAAGAFATVNSRVASSIAGVAIAVALVPPLGVVGLTLEAGQWADAGGALLLFLTNVVSIVLAAVLVFLVTGMASIERLERRRRGTIQSVGSFLAVAMVILVPLTLTSEGLVATAAKESEAQAAAREWVAEEPNVTLERVDVDGTDVEVTVSGSGRPPPVDDLQAELDESFGEPVSLRVELFPSRVIG